MRSTIKPEVASLAIALTHKYWQGFLMWEQACDDDAREGYRPRYCEHGTNQWVDYDPICGPCENGVTMGDGVQRRQRALAQAKARVTRIEELWRTAQMMRRHNVLFDQEAFHAMMRDLREPLQLDI